MSDDRGLDGITTGRLARRLGWTDGQVLTAVGGLIVATVMTLGGLPPVLRKPAIPADRAAVPPLPAGAATPEPDPVAAASPQPAGGPTRPGLGPLPDGAGPSALPGISPAPPNTVAAPPDAIIKPTPAGPLTVSASGWYSADGGGPLQAADVPSGALPVAARAAQRYRIAVVRLAGDVGATVLSLKLADGTGTQQLADQAGVVACPLISKDFRPAPNQSLLAAPLFLQDETCAVGHPDKTRRGWTFDLSRYPGRVGAAFALAPVLSAQAPLFQVSYVPT